MTLYRYFDNEDYARALIERGQMRFNTLAHFRVYEDELVRGDPADGKLRHEPAGGLVLTKISGEVITMPAGWRFTSSVRADHIFVYCLSNVRSEKLAAKFNSPFCVEIKDPARFLTRIMLKVSLRTKLDRRHILRGPVDYRTAQKIPGVDWALPERVAFIKPESFAWQDEYRIVLGKKGAFAPNNVRCAIETGEGATVMSEGQPLNITVGDLSHLSELCHF